MPHQFVAVLDLLKNAVAVVRRQSGRTEVDDLLA